MENVLEDINNNWQLLEDDIYHVIQGNYEERHYRRIVENLEAPKIDLKMYILRNAIKHGFNTSQQEASRTARGLNLTVKLRLWGLIEEMLLIQAEDHGLTLGSRF